ncbi:MAG: L-aspartate oxidase [Clostridia bacterium]|nr:L-aspartate oxidase [Clostridia bacterium]
MLSRFNLKDRYDVIIVGAGVAGLNCALNIPGNKSVLLICKGTPEKSDSYLAQGGICRMQDEGDYQSYFEDTMRAGHGENNPAAVECMIRSSQGVIDSLIEIGVDFARNADGTLAATREGGHSKNRICFHEDCTGKEITSHLMQKVSSLKNVEIIPETVMLDIISSKDECFGIVAHEKTSGKTKCVYADYTVLACGGIGGVFDKSTNFRLLTGDGVAICLKRGVAVDNVNYIQIHPTTLYTDKEGGRSFLISESVRGEGAVLLDKNFKRFTDELQPRDIVTAEIYAQMEKDNTPFVWLDMRGIDEGEVRAHFPGIVKKCAEEGYDVFRECIPVVPAQHYFMGGIRSGLEGKTTLPRLYAVGETCCNGVHGANRLASNSLLESLLFAERAAKDIAQNYKTADEGKAKSAAAKLNFDDYKDLDKLFEEYKNILLNAIKEAENVKPRKHEN